MPENPASVRVWYVVVFSDKWAHSGMHYVQADEHRVADGQHRFVRDDRLVWSAPQDHVAEVMAFACRADAIDFHRRNGARLDRNPVPLRAARYKSASAQLEGFAVRFGAAPTALISPDSTTPQTTQSCTDDPETP